MLRKITENKEITTIYIIVLSLLMLGITYAATSTSSIGLSATAALIGVDESAYGDLTFNSSNLDFRPILDTDVETSTNNVVKIDFKVGGASTNTTNDVIYDIALNDLAVSCELLSPYIKWKLLKNGTQISTGSLDYKFDTIVDGRLVLTSIQQDLPTYSSTASGYDEYTFYMWFSDSCQSASISSCVGKADQSDLLGKTLNGKIEVELYTGSKKALTRKPSNTLENTVCLSNVFMKTIMAPNAKSDENIDFSQTSEESNTNGIYLMNSTKNDANPIYYYRGNVNNNLIFANTCWKVVRTTETGGLKLIYNGTPTNGQCNGSNSVLEYKAFNSSSNSLAYAGYMYSNPYTSSSKSMSSVTSTYYYGNDVSYSNGTYTLTDTISSSSWSSIYNGGLNNNHYVCIDTGGTTCSSVNYIYYTNSSTAYYITLTGGKKVEDALVAMLGADDNNTANYNTTSSTIKGNNTTTGTLDYWYYTNIEQKGYSSYVEDTVWCNDRRIFNKAGFDPNGGNTGEYLYFSAYDRVYTKANPSLTCERNIDSFTVDESNGNGDLDYPVGLLTADEIMLSGTTGNTADSSNTYSYYLYNDDDEWSGSPSIFYGSASMFGINYGDGLLGGANASINSYSVRPSISLKPIFKLNGDGDGTTETPYVVQ